MTNVTAEGRMTLEWTASQPSIAIPVYQREYRWSQDTCYQLLHDIRAVAQRPEGSTHFIGSILASAEDMADVTLVDGQQRVATLMLMLAAIRDLASTSDPDLASTIQSLLASPDDASRPRLRPHERYESVVRSIMTSTPTDLGASSFEQNYAFFLGELADDWRNAWLGMQRLEHVAITLSSKANAQQIFESLNATGTRLSDDELIHNYIHMGRSREMQDALEREVWIPVETSTAGATSEFWRDYLVATSPTQPDVRGEFGVYRAFARRYPDPVRDLTAEVQTEWVRYAERYGILLDPSGEADQDVSAQLDLLRVFEGGPRPFMLRIYDDWRSGAIDKRTFIETSERLQSMWVRRAAVNLSQDIGTVGTLCRRLTESGYPVDGLIALTPEDRQVRRALKYGSAPYIGHVLRRMQQPPAEAQDLQIEHVFPQTPDESWSGDEGKTSWSELTNDEQAEFRVLLNTLGNLTLLEAPLNQGAGNKSFHLKASGFYPLSTVGATQKLAEFSPWNTEAIARRTEQLIDQFIEIWPRPSDSPMYTDAELDRVVDIAVPDGPADPEVFEYIVFDGDVWGDVRNIRALHARVGYTLLLMDEQRFLASPLGTFIHAAKQPHLQYVTLPNGQFMYAGWRPNYLLKAIQETLTEFGLEDRVRAKLLPAD